MCEGLTWFLWSKRSTNKHYWGLAWQGSIRLCLLKGNNFFSGHGILLVFWVTSSELRVWGRRFEEDHWIGSLPSFSATPWRGGLWLEPGSLQFGRRLSYRDWLQRLLVNTTPQGTQVDTTRLDRGNYCPTPCTTRETDLWRTPTKEQ